MANRTVKDAQSIHGTNPQYLVEKIVRTRIYDSRYWKEDCFALTAELLVDKAMVLRSVGGVYGGNIKPTPFLCLILKMLQIQPEKDIIIEFIKQQEFKYVRALGAFYLRLVHSSLDCYKYLEPLLNDYRKIRMMNRQGKYVLSHMDEFIDNLLREDRYCDVIMPRIQKRWVHEGGNELDPRVSLLDDDLDDLESESEEEDEFRHSVSPPNTHSKKDRDGYRNGIRDDHHYGHNRSSPSRDGRSDRDKRDRDKRRRSWSREKDRDRDERKKRRSRSKDKRHRSPGHRHRDRHDRSGKDVKESRRRDREGRKHHKDKHGRDRERDRDRRKHHKERKDRDRYIGDHDMEIAQANALRAELGIPLLRQ